MKIIALETHHIAVPFSMGARAGGIGGVGVQAMHTLLLRVVTDQGIEGWGEGFGHACCPATRTVLDTQVAPAVLGADARDIAGLHDRLARPFHLFGRNGPHLAGALGAALCAHCFGQGWVRRVQGTRALMVTPQGNHMMRSVFGLQAA